MRVIACFPQSPFGPADSGLLLIIKKLKILLFRGKLKASDVEIVRKSRDAVEHRHFQESLLGYPQGESRGNSLTLQGVDG